MSGDWNGGGGVYFHINIEVEANAKIYFLIWLWKHWSQKNYIATFKNFVLHIRNFIQKYEILNNTILPSAYQNISTSMLNNLEVHMETFKTKIWKLLNGTYKSCYIKTFISNIRTFLLECWKPPNYVYKTLVPAFKLYI